MRGLVVVLALLGLQARLLAQSIEPEPGVVEEGGVVEIRAWSLGGVPLTSLEIGLRRLHVDGTPDGGVIARCTTDDRGLATLRVDGEPGRYRLEAERAGVQVQSSFRVVPTAPRLAWFVFGVGAVGIAVIVLRRPGAFGRSTDETRGTPAV